MNPIDPSESALLVIDLQNDTVGEQGAFADSFRPWRRALVVEKQRMSSFNSTTLDTKLLVHAPRCSAAEAPGSPAPPPLVRFADRPLRGRTNFAIEHTCRDGADDGYEVVLVSDGTATISEWQQAALSHALTNIVEPATVDEVVAVLGA